MRLNLSFLRIFPISLFFFFLDIKKGLDSLKPLFMRFPSHLIPNFPAKSLFLFFSHFKWLDTTALFLVIFAENWLKEKSHESSLLGLGIALVFLLIIGKEYFLIPTLIGIWLILTMRITKLETKLESLK